MTRVLGIDPGKDGAAVLLDGRLVIASVRTRDLIGKADWHAGYGGVTAWLRATHAEHRIGLAVLELHAGRPGEGGGSARTIGVGWGIWLGALSALEIPVITPAAARWTRTMLVDIGGEGKERAIAVARPIIDLTPGRRRKPHDGLADAVCLALYGQTHPLARVAV